MNQPRVVEKRDGDKSFFFIKAGWHTSFAKDPLGQEIIAWCEDNFGPRGVRWKAVINMVDFVSDDDACAFKLRWM